jgi:glyoxylase-like metal-dependent hydrolase (beta-lactamase superfamily II)
MDKIKNFGHTQTATITVLVDNRADLIVKSTDTVRRYTKEPLLAEHGLAALIELGDRSDRSDAGVRILWDAGMTHIALLENMRRMQIDPATIDVIALSHGHGDHTAAMTEVIKAMVAGCRWSPTLPPSGSDGGSARMDPGTGLPSHRRVQSGRRSARRSSFPKARTHWGQDAGPRALSPA